MRRKQGWIVAVLMVLGLLQAGVLAAPAAGHGNISFGPGNDVGASADTVYSVALGDLDNDGDLDIVSGSSVGEDYELIVWENDGTPFSELWTPNDVGLLSYSVQWVAVGDLDNNGDLDIVSGDSGGRLTVWQNDGGPFTGIWTSNQVGQQFWGAPVALGDLDN
ncbi:MAG TPA: VCBS repeat-containing protein, partial [Chloroflexi bacterium]|nr:VCBS repeat-containing protein [Chloroflexota bacterium]